MIVVATDDFELYHDLVGELRDRRLTFTTVEPGTSVPERTRVVLRGAEDPPPDEDVVDVIAPDADGGRGGDVDRGSGEGRASEEDRGGGEGREVDARRAVDDALATLRDGAGRTVVGVDPGERPGIAVLEGETVVAAFHVPLAAAADRVREEVADAVAPLVRIGDGARRQGARLIDALDDLPVELVDETGTTPHLGTGARGMGDVLAAVNVARIEGERVDSRSVEPTAGELERIKAASRRRSGNRTIDERLARRVASGELSLRDALEEHESA